VKKINLDRVTRAIGRSVLHTKKQSPHIFFVGGVVCVVSSTILACRATLKMDKTMDKILTDRENLREIKEGMRDGTTAYPIHQYRKDVFYIRRTTVLEIGKLYGPPFILGALGIAALTGSHIQLTKRNTALMAAYAAVQKAYYDYRQRVAEQFGEERELDIYRATGKEIVQTSEGHKEVVQLTNPNGLSPYARCFDECSREWQKDKEYNEAFILCQQTHANDMLKARGHIFLNEVYDLLGFDRTTAGTVVGWVWPGNGDDFVDFGLYEAVNRNCEYMNGMSPSFWLDFNVDGVINNLI